MPRRLLTGALVCLSAFFALLPLVRAEDEPRFQMGFEMLANLIPEIAGQPLENERHNALNGDGLQMTTRGLMAWRKADNWTAFTNGWWTWVNGPLGLQDRANYERFEWEADAATFVLAPERTPTADATLALYPTRTQTPAATWDAATSPTPMPEATTTPSTPPTAVPSLTAAPAASPTAAPTRTLAPTRVPTQTPRPTATAVPTSTPRPTSTPQPTATTAPTATQQTGGVRSPDPAGRWVTSVSALTKYYCYVDSPYWTSWSASNRIWFPTEAALLAVYPDRVRQD